MYLLKKCVICKRQVHRHEVYLSIFLLVPLVNFLTCFMDNLKSNLSLQLGQKYVPVNCFTFKKVHRISYSLWYTNYNKDIKINVVKSYLLFTRKKLKLLKILCKLQIYNYYYNIIRQQLITKSSFLFLLRDPQYSFHYQQTSIKT